jgi:hypothetical protein
LSNRDAGWRTVRLCVWIAIRINPVTGVGPSAAFLGFGRAGALEAGVCVGAKGRQELHQAQLPLRRWRKRGVDERPSLCRWRRRAACPCHGFLYSAGPRCRWPCRFVLNVRTASWGWTESPTIDRPRKCRHLAPASMAGCRPSTIRSATHPVAVRAPRSPPARPARPAQ